MAPLGGASFYTGLYVYREIHIKRSLSKTTELTLTKFGREWKLNYAQIKVLAPFGSQKEATLGEILSI